jgi:hypothetical protein
MVRLSYAIKSGFSVEQRKASVVQIRLGDSNLPSPDLLPNPPSETQRIAPGRALAQKLFFFTYILKNIVMDKDIK